MIGTSSSSRHSLATGDLRYTNLILAKFSKSAFIPLVLNVPHKRSRCEWRMIREKKSEVAVTATGHLNFEGVEDNHHPASLK